MEFKSMATRLSELEVERVDAVDKPANKRPFFLTKNEGLTSDSLEKQEFEKSIEEYEVDLETEKYIEKADQRGMQAVNESLRLLRPVARAVDGEARTLLVRVIRLLETSFGIAGSDVLDPQDKQPSPEGDGKTEMKNSTKKGETMSDTTEKTEFSAEVFKAEMLSEIKKSSDALSELIVAEVKKAMDSLKDKEKEKEAKEKEAPATSETADVKTDKKECDETKKEDTKKAEDVKAIAEEVKKAITDAFAEIKSSFATPNSVDNTTKDTVTKSEGSVWAGLNLV